MAHKKGMRYLLAMLLLACDTTEDNPNAVDEPDAETMTCAMSAECRVSGHCGGELGDCYPRSDADCASSQDCHAIGRCGLGESGPGGYCAVTPSGCGRSADCQNEATRFCHADWSSTSSRAGVCVR